jgi:hypothetical protein
METTMPRFRVRLKETIYHETDVYAPDRATAITMAQKQIDEDAEFEFWEVDSSGLSIDPAEADLEP